MDQAGARQGDRPDFCSLPEAGDFASGPFGTDGVGKTVFSNSVFYAILYFV